jgi:dehydrogenase/reductase SDR family protein 7
MFKDQVIWITGASSGIGEALALQFAAEGARLVLSARREPELQRVKQLCADQGLAADNVLVLTLDVTDHASMPAALDRIIETFGRIDMLINNAGISQRSRCVDTDKESRFPAPTASRHSSPALKTSMSRRYLPRSPASGSE